MRYARIELLGLERGHRTLAISRKGGKVVTILLAPRTARAIDLAIGERTEGPVFRAVERRRLDWHGAGRIVRRTARCAGIGKDHHAPHAAARRHRQLGRGRPVTRSAYAGRVRCLAGIFVRRRADWRPASAVRRVSRRVAYPMTEVRGRRTAVLRS